MAGAAGFAVCAAAVRGSSSAQANRARREISFKIINIMGSLPVKTSISDNRVPEPGVPGPVH